MNATGFNLGVQRSLASATAANTVYFSYLINFSSDDEGLNGFSDQARVGIRNSVGQERATLGDRGNSSANWTASAGSSANGTSLGTSSIPIQVDQTHLLVTRVDFLSGLFDQALLH